MLRPFPTLFRIKFADHSLQSLVHPLCRSISLRVIRCRPNLLNAEQFAHCCDHVAGKLSTLVGHESLGESENGKKVIVQHSGGGESRMILRNKGLDITGKVVHYYQHILHHRLLFGGYGNLHSYVVDVYQFHRLGTHDRFHAGNLGLRFKLLTPAAVLEGQTQGHKHSGPPEQSFKEALHSVSPLVSSIPVTHFDGYLSSVDRDNKYWDSADILRWSGLYK